MGVDVVELSMRRFAAVDGDSLSPSILNFFEKHGKPRLIVHAATDYGRSSFSAKDVFYANVVLPFHLLDILARNENSFFFNFDSFYSSAHFKLASDDPLAAYACSKRQFRDWGKIYSQSRLLDFVNLQLFHVYGSGDRDGKFIPSLIRACKDGRRMELSDCRQRRDFIHVDDVVDAFECVFRYHTSRPALGYAHYEVGTAVATPVRDLVERVNEHFGSTAQLLYGARPLREGEPLACTADLSKLRSLGWVPRYSVRDGVKKMLSEL
jgi:CDP-paratose synthetase